jgi:hypothetical protein
VKWKCKSRQFDFRLLFRAVPYNGLDTPQVNWPFDAEAAREPGTDGTPWLKGGSFKGTLAVEGAFKYEVQVLTDSGAIVVLDPMIIVGK